MKHISKYITDFLEYCEVEKGLSPTSVKNYAQFLSQFLRYLDTLKLSTLSPEDLNSEIVWKYRLYLSRKKGPRGEGYLTKATQAYYLIALRGLLAYFVEKDIQSLPPDKIKLPKGFRGDNVKFLKIDELEKLLLAPNLKDAKGLRDRAILETFFSTGLRLAELVSLNINDLGNISNKGDLELKITGKGNRTRTVYFSGRCLEWLRKYLTARIDDDEALFIHYNPGRSSDSGRLSARSIQRIVKYYALKAGLPHSVTPHVLRHTYATDLLGQGVDLRMIQEFLGHKNIMTTQVYTHVTSKHLKDIHKKFHSGDRLKNE